MKEEDVGNCKAEFGRTILVQKLVQSTDCKFAIAIHELALSDTHTDGTEHLASACRHETEMIG
jgi:hypothetical protein